MRLAGIVLGLGLGGFVDGITLHQILQWHNMGSAVLPPTTMDAMAQNMVCDGLFHAATLILTLFGVLMLWSDGVAGLSPRHLSVLVGQMILGWGLFNLVEGVIDHHLLNIHHVPGPAVPCPDVRLGVLGARRRRVQPIGLFLARGTRELPPTRT